MTWFFFLRPPINDASPHAPTSNRLWPVMRRRARDAEVSPDGESFETKPPLAWLSLVVGPPALLFAREARAGGTAENVKHTTRKDLQTCLPAARHKRRAGIRKRSSPLPPAWKVWWWWCQAKKILLPLAMTTRQATSFFLWVSSPGAPRPRPPGWSQVRIVMGRRAAGGGTSQWKHQAGGVVGQRLTRRVHCMVGSTFAPGDPSFDSAMERDGPKMSLVWIRRAT